MTAALGWVALWLAWGIPWAILCRYTARTRGHDPEPWTILGLLFNAFTFLALIATPTRPRRY